LPENCARAAPKNDGIAPFAFGNSARGLNQLIVPQNMKRRPIKSFRLAIAPMPQRAQYCRLPVRESVRNREPRHGLFRVALTVNRRRHIARSQDC